MGYRKLYEKETRRTVPKTFCIHHLDFDRENNSIDNLVAIPKKLHKNYHAHIQGAETTARQIKLDQKSLIPQAVNKGSNKSIIWTLEKLEELTPSFRHTVEIIEEIKCWICYRDFLLGTMRNIFELNYDIDTRAANNF